MRWTDEKIQSELLKCIDILMVNRMPSSEELKSIGRNDLHCKISRTNGGYRGWAFHLDLPLKSSDTRTGQIYEDIVETVLIKMGYRVGRMTTKHPYDLLVNGTVKIDVKAGKEHHHYGCKAFTFHLAKENPTCDIYIFVAVGESDVVENYFIVPSHFVKMKTVNLGIESKYNLFINRWDFIKQYSYFFNSVELF